MILHGSVPAAQPITAILIFSLLWMTGCSSYRPIPHTQGQPTDQELRIGDRVRITTVDGSTHEFTVHSVNTEYIEGKSERFAWESIRTLSVKKTSGAKTTGLIVGIVVGILVLGAIAVDGAFDDFGDGFDPFSSD